MRQAIPILLASVLFAAGAIALPRAAHTEPAATDAVQPAERGQAVFTAQGCYLCHGHAGQGARGVGATLAPMKLDDAAFARYVRSPRGSMPAYGRAILSDADLAAITAYLHALPAPRPAGAIPLLAGYVAAARPAPGEPGSGAVQVASKAAPAGADGKVGYLENCSGCHGADRQGGAGPNLQAEASARDAAAVARLIMTPPPGMPKLYPRPLGDAQVKAIAAYVVSH